MAKTRLARDYTRDIIDLKEKFDDAKEHIGEPPDGQIPLNDWGIYTSPNLQSDEPVSPFDCEQYPESPYCGGNPWTTTPVGLEPEWGFDECGAWVQLNPVLGFTKLPPVSVGWRRPGKCREEEKPDPPEPRPEDESRPVTPLKFPKTIDPNVNVFIVLLRKYRYFFGWQQNDKDQFGNFPPIGSTREVIVHSLVNTVFPSSDSNFVESYFPSPATGLSYPILALGGATMRENKQVVVNSYEVDYSERPWTYEKTVTATNHQIEATGWITKDHANPQVPNWKRYIHRELKGQYFIVNFSQPNFLYPLASVAIYGKISEISKDWEGYVVDSSFIYKKGINGATSDGGWILKEEWEIAYISIPDKNKFPPPPDQRRKKKCCMKCCTNHGQANKKDQDLSEIKKMLRDIKKRLGTDEYPVLMPESLNVKYDDKGKRTEPRMINEQNLTAVIGRFIRYFDGIVGEWGLGFKVADADPTKPGDQPKFITANNISELLEEVYSHVFDMWIQNYQFLQLNQRHAMESMLTRKIAIQNYYLIQSLVDWCGFKTKDIKKKIPFLFNIDAEGFEDFLKNKEQELVVPDFDPDDKGADSFPDHLIRLKRAAAIIEAVHTSKFKNSDDIPKKIMEMLLNTSKSIDRVNNDELKTAGSKEDFDQWLRDVETGFIARTGQGDINNPYGVPYSDRPRLTKITEEDPTPGDGE